MKSTIVTSIGRGVPTKRRYIGQYYVGTNDARLAHSTMQGSCTRGAAEYKRAAVYEEDDRLYLERPNHMTGQNYRKSVALCQHCPRLVEMDTTWKEAGMCYDTQDEGFFDISERERIIEEYCNCCPVALPCLEYGAALQMPNVGSIWGGVYFLKNASNREKAINARRQELNS